MTATAFSIKNRLTDDEFFELCRMNDLRMERTKTGNIIIMEPTGGETGNFNFEVGGELRDWNKSHKEGKAFDSSTGFKLPSTAIKSPDVAWVARERWEKLPIALRKKFPPITPDFIIEIRSESDSLEDLKEKMVEYMDNGCRLAWLIDREEQKTYIYRANSSYGEETVSFDETLSGENVLMGFTLRINDLDWE
jgi:Uma2 family endonuclease